MRHLITIFSISSIGLLFAPFLTWAAFHQSFPPPPSTPPPSVADDQDDAPLDETIDFSITGIGNPKRMVKNTFDGILIPFTIESAAKRTYGVEVSLICADFQTDEIYQVRSGVSQQSIFQIFQSAAIGRDEGMWAFKNGKKVESCELDIAHVQHEDFFDLRGPADADLTNNAMRFTMRMVNGKPVVSDTTPALDSIAERVKQLQQPLSDGERQAYAVLSKEKCLNILIASDDRGTYYNGELIEEDAWEDRDGPNGLPAQAHIAGDRLGYILGDVVIVDGAAAGSIDPNRYGYALGPEQFKLNEKHFVYFQTVGRRGTGRISGPRYHLLYDDQDLGEAAVIFYTLNGDNVIYQRTVKRGGKDVYQLFANGKKIADGAFGDYDGKNLAYVDVNRTHSVIYNGKRQGYGGNITLKDGHFAFVRTKTANGGDERVYYDGKNMGPGGQPVIEKHHLAFLRAKAQVDPRSEDRHSKVIYDKKELGYIGGSWGVSLAGDHIAYMRKLGEQEVLFTYPKDFARVNIDGKDYPGDFISQSVYVEITEKKERSTCQ